MKSLSALALALSVVSSACTTDTSSGITQAEVVCPTDSTLTYANFGQAFFTDNCLSCHTSKERPTLTSQAAILANKAVIIREAVTSTSMPEDASMDIAERRMLGEWLACGAP
jgi:mono/diheme cytochrome c family protein